MFLTLFGSFWRHHEWTVEENLLNVARGHRGADHEEFHVFKFFSKQHKQKVTVLVSDMDLVLRLSE